MSDTYVTIPQMTAATDGQVNDNILLEVAIPDGGSYVSRKVTKGQLVADLKSDLTAVETSETATKAAVKTINETLYPETENLLDVSKMVSGYLNNGQIVSSEIYKTTEFIKVSGLSYVNLSNYIKQYFNIQSKAIRFSAYYSADSESAFLSQDSTNESTKTIPNNAVYARFSISNDFLSNYPMLISGNTAPTHYYPYVPDADWKRNKLYGKTALFYGDSICYGKNWRPDTTLIPNSNSGWALKLQERYNMINYGYGNEGAVYPKTGDSNNTVLNQVLRSLYTLSGVTYKPDYFILSGGINDAANEVAKGSITATFTEPAVYNTEYSAIEFIFYRLKTLFPQSKVGVILPHHASGYAQQSNLQDYIAIIKDCCEKWAIPYCDLYTLCQINGCIELTSYRSLFFDEWGVHPNELGYEIMTDLIAQWMMTL